MKRTVFTLLAVSGLLVGLGVAPVFAQSNLQVKANIPFEFMVSGKWRVPVSEKLRLQPALYLGFIQAFADDPDERNKGLGLNGSLEGRYAVTEKAFLFAEVGLMTQVYGGVTHIGYARTKYPLACLTVGAGF